MSKQLYHVKNGKVVPMREPCPNPKCVGPGCATCKQVAVVWVCGNGDFPVFQLTGERT